MANGHQTHICKIRWCIRNFISNIKSIIFFKLHCLQPSKRFPDHDICAALVFSSIKFVCFFARTCGIPSSLQRRHAKASAHFFSAIFAPKQQELITPTANLIPAEFEFLFSCVCIWSHSLYSSKFSYHIFLLLLLSAIIGSSFLKNGSKHWALNLT